MSRTVPPATRVTEPILSVDGVSVRLGGREVLRDVGFTVAPGEFTGLIGSNGAGKTTLFRVILGLQAPTAGHVSVGGGAPAGSWRDGRSVGAGWCRRRVVRAVAIVVVPVVVYVLTGACVNERLGDEMLFWLD